MFHVQVYNVRSTFEMRNRNVNHSKIIWNKFNGESVVYKAKHKNEQILEKREEEEEEKKWKMRRRRGGGRRQDEEAKAKTGCM